MSASRRVYCNRLIRLAIPGKTGMVTAFEIQV
jgi:hypothetical protein